MTIPGCGHKIFLIHFTWFVMGGGGGSDFRFFAWLALGPSFYPATATFLSVNSRLRL
jgi:hypothetical protein